ncbi:MAG: lipoprotein signal peptidase [Candidatus Hydrogenedentota bacterium]
MTERKKQLLWVTLAVLAGIVSDQCTKEWINRTIPAGSVPFKPDTFFFLTHERNTGIIGGRFSGVPVVPFAAPILASLILLYLFPQLNPASRTQSIGFGLVVAGAAGNLFDRIVRGGVIDFLQFHFYFIDLNLPWKLYPAFNVADAWICLGVALLLFGWRHTREDKESDVPNAA